MRRANDNEFWCWLEGARAGYVTGLFEPLVVSDEVFDRLLDHNAYKLLRHATSDQYAVLHVSDGEEEGQRPARIFLRASVLDDLPVYVVSCGFPAEGVSVCHASTSETLARRAFAEQATRISTDVAGVDELRRSEGAGLVEEWPDAVLLHRWSEGVRTLVDRWMYRFVPLSVAEAPELGKELPAAVPEPQKEERPMRSIDRLVAATHRRHDDEWSDAVRQPLIRDLVCKIDEKILPLLRSAPVPPGAPESRRQLLDERGSVVLNLYSILPEGGSVVQTWLHIAPSNFLVPIRPDREGVDVHSLGQLWTATSVRTVLAIVDELLAVPAEPADLEGSLATRGTMVLAADRWIDALALDLRVRVRKQADWIPDNQFRPDGPWNESAVGNFMVGIVRDKYR